MGIISYVEKQIEVVYNPKKSSFHKEGIKFHRKGQIEIALLNYKKALSVGNHKTNIHYRYNKKIMMDYNLALYHLYRFPVKKTDHDDKASGKELLDQMVLMPCPENCNCYLNHYQLKQPWIKPINEFKILLGFKGVTNINDIYDNFELQIRSEGLYMYRPWYEKFSDIVPLKIEKEGYELFMCYLDYVNYRQGQSSNMNLDFYVYRKAESPVDFAGIGLKSKPDYDGDGNNDSHFVSHDRYDDTWRNHFYYGYDGVYDFK